MTASANIELIDESQARAHLAVEMLHVGYSACLDRAEFNAWLDFFVDDYRYRVQSEENYGRGLPHAPIYCEGKGMLRDRVSATRVMVYEPRRQRRFPRVCEFSKRAPSCAA